nr:hypothetical protein [uncultured Halomonas sp.]
MTLPWFVGNKRGIQNVQTQKSPKRQTSGLNAQNESVFSLQFWPQATNLSSSATQFAVCDAPNAQNDEDILQQKRRSFDETRRFANFKFSCAAYYFASNTAGQGSKRTAKD